MKVDYLIIGSGAVGLATAYQLLLKNPDNKVVIVEKENEVAKHQTGNNSGVIHSGIYYKPNSLKAINCIEGYHLLLKFAQENNIPFELCGKVIVASDHSELIPLENIYNRGIENGLNGIQKLDSLTELQQYEPHITGIKGLYVPQTGIIDYKLVAIKLAENIKTLGGQILFNHKVKSIKEKSESIEVLLEGTQENIQASHLINCAGLYSDKVTLMTEDYIDYKIIPFRGEYYKLKPEKEYLVKSLIYPVPDSNFPFLGVHFTKMMKGGVEAGPNAVLAYQREGYHKSDINLTELFDTITYPGFIKVAIKYYKTGWDELLRSYSKKLFTKALQKLVPEITEDDLVVGGAGVRAQACDIKGNLLDDFKIIRRGNITHVGNAPSPAATSCLAIGKTIVDGLD